MQFDNVWVLFQSVVESFRDCFSFCLGCFDCSLATLVSVSFRCFFEIFVHFKTFLDYFDMFWECLRFLEVFFLPNSNATKWYKMYSWICWNFLIFCFKANSKIYKKYGIPNFCLWTFRLVFAAQVFGWCLCVYSTKPTWLVDQASRGPVEQFLGLEAVVTPKHGLRQCTRQGELDWFTGIRFPRSGSEEPPALFACRRVEMTKRPGFSTSSLLLANFLHKKTCIFHHHLGKVW